MTLYGSLIMYSTNAEDVNRLRRLVFTVNRNEDIVRESFSFKIIFRST